MKLKFLVLFLLAVLACKRDGQNNSSKKEGLVKTYREDGSVYQEANYVNEKLHGVCKTYHPNGKVYKEENFANNVIHGKALQYYQTGILYSETYYDSGKIDGIVKLYHKDGKLKAEAPYKKGCACVGLKEYVLNGDPRPHYPEIVIQTEDKILSSGFYYIYLTLTERVKSVQFYTGNLKDGCLYEGEGLDPIPTDSKTNRGEIRYVMSPGRFVMEQINIVAKIETIAGNTLVKQKTYNVAIDFPLF